MRGKRDKGRKKKEWYRKSEIKKEGNINERIEKRLKKINFVILPRQEQSSFLKSVLAPAARFSYAASHPITSIT